LAPISPVAEVDETWHAPFPRAIDGTGQTPRIARPAVHPVLRPTAMTAVVTGAGRGIGRAIALELARKGHAVGLQARSVAQLESTKAAIEAEGGRAVVVPGDVTRADSATELVERTAEAFGAPWIAVGAAGQAISAPLLRTGEDQLRSLLDVNLISAFHLMKASASAMIAAKDGGRIVIIGSTASVVGMRYTAAYSASKHAVMGLVKSAALELAKHRITVNALCPGWVDTPMFDATLENISRKTGCSLDEARATIEGGIPVGAALDVAEVAAQLSWVVSEAAGKLTGQALVRDGGESL